MRRVTYIVLLSIIWLPFVSRAHTATKPPQTNGAISGADYHEIAEYISRRVLALKGKVRGFEFITSSKHIYLLEHPFKPVVAYNHGVAKWEPIADAEPPMNRAVYSARGFTVVIWMVNGDLTWSPPRLPVKVGRYTVSAEIAGPQRARIQRVIDQIVADAANRFNR